MLRAALRPEIARCDAARYLLIVTAQCDLGGTWIRRKSDHNQYLSVGFGDPGSSKKISAALFYSLDEQVSRLVRRGDELRTSQDRSWHRQNTPRR